MIFLGETDDEARKVAFHLPDANDPLTPITGHAFVAGEVRIRIPGGAYVDADPTRIVEEGYGDYALKLTDAQVAVAGKVFIRVNVTGAQPWTSAEDIINRQALSGSTGSFTPAGARSWTLAQLRRGILRRAGIKEAGTADLTKSILNEFVNEAIAELHDLLLTKADDRLVTKMTLNVTANTESQDLPSSFYQLRKVEIVDGSAPSGYRQLHPVALDAKHLYSQVTSRRYRYYPHGYQLDLVPMQVQAETLRIYYIPVAAVLVDDNDAIDGWNGYEELIIQLGYRRVLVRQDLSPTPAETEIARLVGRISQAADGRDAEPFYLDPRGPRRHWDDDDYDLL
jgi:hypothetical protein